MDGWIAGNAFAAAPNAQIVVAKSGGNYTTITAALNAITPSAAKPYVIEVWPGTYNEYFCVKDYVHLKGSGPEVTTVTSVAWNTISVCGSNVIISGLTISGGISLLIEGGTSPTITGNIIKNCIGGIEIRDTSSKPIITGNKITGCTSWGIANWSGSAATITENKITGNSSQDIWVDSTATPNISFNIYDTINGITGVGQYNVNSNGDPAPAP